MAEDIFLADDLLRQLIGVGEVDILVGISSQSNENTSRQASDAIERSFQKYFTRQRAVIVDASGGRNDKSEEVAAGNGDAGAVLLRESASLRTIHRVNANFPVSPTPGMALRTILAAADLLRARACVVVSPATTNLTPERVANLLKPAYHDKFDFVAPLYSRQKYQGLLARNLLYPMSRAIFGRGIRELYSDEWAFSGRLATACLNQNVWHEESIGVRPEAWMAVSAISSDFRCCQVFLGPKGQSQTASGAGIIEVFRQTVGNLFWCMESFQSDWLEGMKSETVQSFGPDHELTSEPTDVNRHSIFELFRNGVKELEPILSSILDPETHKEINSIASLGEDKFRFSPDLWVRVLYDFATSYHHAVMNRDHLIQAMVPLYRGVTFSYLAEHSNSSTDEMEALNEALCLEFERQRPYLTKKWKENVEVKS